MYTSPLHFVTVSQAAMMLCGVNTPEMVETKPEPKGELMKDLLVSLFSLHVKQI